MEPFCALCDHLGMYGEGGESARRLALELLDDLESGERTSRAVLFKGARLARLRELSKVERWIDFELRGYDPSDSLAREFMHYTRRWADESRDLGWWDALPVIEQRIESLKLRLQNPSAQAPVANGERTEAQRITNLIARLSGIECSVQALLHAFAEDTLRKFAATEALQHDRFEPHRERVHEWLIERADAWAPLAERYDRSMMGDADAARSLALGCMALLAAAADKLQPAEDGASGPNPDGFGARLLAFILSDRCAPERRRRLRHTLMDLTDRLSLAEHGDVSAEEASYLYLTAYLFLSELSRFRPGPGHYWLTASS